MAIPAGGRIKIILLLLLLLPGFGLFPQNKKAKDESSDKAPSTFKLPVGVVVVNATVTDKQENAVTYLTREDFRIYEDGKLQTIQTFALESHNPVNNGETEPNEAAINAVKTAEPNVTRPRLISIMIDDLSSVIDDGFIRIAEAVATFIEKDMGPGDQIGIWSGSGKVDYPFSSDRQILIEEVAALPQKLDRSSITRSECPILTDLQAQKIANNRDDPISLEIAVRESLRCLNINPDKKSTNEVDSQHAANWGANLIMAAENHSRLAATTQYQETMHRNRNLLQALRRHLRSLRHFDATKSIVLFSDGFLQQDLIYELQDIVEQALRFGVVISTVDIRGMYNPSFIPADTPIISKARPFFEKQREYTDDALAQGEPLSQLANDTGGVYFHNNNDIYKGIQQISSRQEYYYILTYAIPPQKPDGRFHRIKVEVIRPGLQVSYRKGYYAPKEEVTFERQKKEDILEALQAPGNLNEIPMGLSYNCYQDDDTTYNVSVLMKIGIRGLRFLDEDSRHKNLISLVVVAFDEADQYVKGVEKSVDFRLTDASYVGLLDRGITSTIEFKLPVGRYRIKAVVREASQGKIGSLTKAIEIP